MTTRPAIVISSLDSDRIEALLERAAKDAYPDLRAELNRADVLDPQQMPADVITMNSVVSFRDETGGAEKEVTLVYPRDADGKGERISVLTPVGTALLGLRVGQSIDWAMPGGKSTRLQVTAVRYQPEASGDFTR